jgi:hypothetical protein
LIRLFLLSCLAVFSFIATPDRASACAACYGQSDSPLAKGLVWGVFALIAVVVPLLVGIAAFFIYISKRSALTAAEQIVQPSEPKSI